MIPTAEQQAILDTVAQQTRGALKIHAGPGTGKTAVLRMIGARLAEQQRNRILYLAYNRALANEAKDKFEGLADVMTIHALTNRALHVKRSGRRIVSKLDDRDAARILGVKAEGGSRRISAATQTLKAFLQSADTELSEAHVPKTYRSDEDVEAIVRDARDLFTALRADSGERRLPITHDIYLKTWHLSGAPGLDRYDTVLLDEAQDANPMVVQALSHAPHAVYVGDEHQQIYAFIGAVDALARIEGPTLALTQSFRFGPAIAEAANRLLAHKSHPGEFRLRGTPSIDSRIARVDVKREHTRLYWTNAAMIEDLVFLADMGRAPMLAAGGEELAKMLTSAWALHEAQHRRVKHPFVRLFSHWDDFADAAARRGGEAQHAVQLIDVFEHRVPDVIERLKSDPEHVEVKAWLTTAHKSKGREWPQVLISNDFDDLIDSDEGKGPGDQDINLAYVAITRAMHRLELQSDALAEIVTP